MSSIVFFTVVSVIASLLLLCFAFHFPCPVTFLCVSETSLSFSITTSVSKEFVVVFKRCSTDLLTHTFLSSPRRIISIWQLFRCLFWLQSDELYLCYHLTVKFQAITSWFLSWELDNLIILFAVQEGCLTSIAEIMLYDFEPKRQKKCQSQLFQLGLFNCGACLMAQVKRQCCNLL